LYYGYSCAWVFFNW